MADTHSQKTKAKMKEILQTLIMMGNASCNKIQDNIAPNTTRWYSSEIKMKETVVTN